jgi:DNA-binding transcriptional MerR regulator
LVKRLLDTGVSLQQIRIAITQLRAAGINDLAKTTLMSDGVKVYMCNSDEEVIDLLERGQGVFGIAVGRVLKEVEASLSSITPSALEEVDELEARRAARRAI